MHEALFLSEKEELTIIGILKNIEQEYHGHIDKFTQNIIVAQLEVLLNYSERFFQRQFVTRKITNTQLLIRMEDYLTQYFNSDELISKGLPTVKSISEHLNISPNYLSALLKSLTGKSTQQHIQDKIIEKARHQLATTNLSVGEIAYNLGFVTHNRLVSYLSSRPGCRRLSVGLHLINWPHNRLQPFLRRSF